MYNTYDPALQLSVSERSSNAVRLKCAYYLDGELGGREGVQLNIHESLWYSFEDANLLFERAIV